MKFGHFTTREGGGMGSGNSDVQISLSKEDLKNYHFLFAPYQTNGLIYFGGPNCCVHIPIYSKPTWTHKGP